MEYKIETKPAFTLIGYKRRFEGAPGGEERFQQEHDFACETRLNQFVLKGMSRDLDTMYDVAANIGPEGYDYYLSSLVPDWDLRKKELGEDASRFEEIHIPEQLYLICQTEKCKWPCNIHSDLRRRMVSQWLPTSGYQLAQAPELAVIHWPYERDNEKVNSTRFVEVWLPIEKNVE